MNTSWFQRFVRFGLGVFACFACATRTHAHEPFDVSSRMILYEDRLELVVTLGTDGLKTLLSREGRSPEQIAESLQSLGPDRPVIQPTTLTARLYELKSNGELMIPKSVKSVSEGAENLVTSTFTRPVPGALEIRATCYETIPGLRNGVMIVEDELAGQLGAGLLSPARPRLTVTVPELPAKTGTASEASSATSSETTSPPAVPAASPVRPSLGTYFALGVEHILIGIDHLLFLAVLLVGVRRLGSMLGVITCFTLAHSVTLALAALEWVTISSRIIEPLIAASIIVVCVLNLIRKHAEADRVGLAAGFGLIHGFGFASVLRETGLGEAGGSFVWPLLSFNLGVETGQLAIAAIFLPLLFLARRAEGFVRYGLPAISAVVLVVSGYWLVERAFF